MSAIVQWLFHTEAGHFFLYFVFSNAVSTMPAPTANSGFFQVWVFRFSNAIASNLSRAFSTKVESSPNFQAAVNVQTTQQGVAPITVQPVTPKP
jgi:hypothetical protein